jgi:ech hydrogenase subunit F
MPWMIPTVLKNFFSGPSTRRYPYTKREPFKDARGKVSWDMSKCDLCHDCERICPVGAITVEDDKERITFDPFQCVYCRSCAEGCFHGAILCSLQYAPAETEKIKEVYEKDEKKEAAA